MPIQTDEFIQAYNALEKDRTIRNRWIALGLAGVAVGATVGVLTGDYNIGGLIAVGSSFVVESVVLDAQDAVSSHRRHLRSLIGLHAPQPELDANIVSSNAGELVTEA